MPSAARRFVRAVLPRAALFAAALAAYGALWASTSQDFRNGLGYALWLRDSVNDFKANLVAPFVLAFFGGVLPVALGLLAAHWGMRLAGRWRRR